MHIYDKKLNFITSGIVAGGCSIACGIGLSIKKKQKDLDKRAHVWCILGDGAEDAGRFIEATRFALARELPVTFIIEDNDLSIDSTKKDRWPRYSPIKASNIIRYQYERKYPHVGVGKWISF